MGIYRFPLEPSLFVLDTDQCKPQLWQLDKVGQPIPVKLRRKNLAVLCYLVDRAGCWVSINDLLQDVWNEHHVNRSMNPRVSQCITKLRDVFKDNHKTSHYISSRKKPDGAYQFIAPVTSISSIISVHEHHSSDEVLSIDMVGREAEMRILQDCFERARIGEPHTIFVTGKAGIGKTTLVQEFLERNRISGQALVGYGKSTSLNGHAPPYEPFKNALKQVCSGPGGEHFRQLMQEHAPTWFVEMDAALKENQRETLRRQTADAPEERKLKEFDELMGKCSTGHLLILCIDDLHESDEATLNLVYRIASQSYASERRLLLLGTYRPHEMRSESRPALQKLQMQIHLHRNCDELRLEGLTKDDVKCYFEKRLRVLDASMEELADLIHQRTDGDPTFMIRVINYLCSQGSLKQIDGQWQLTKSLKEVGDQLPYSVNVIFQTQTNNLTVQKQHLLKVCSIAGLGFPIAAVAKVLNVPPIEVETQCWDLINQGQFLQTAAEEGWPDSIVTAPYRFIHMLDQEFWYKRTSEEERKLYHEKIADYLEGAYGTRAWKIAERLSMHYEKGEHPHRAVPFLAQAGENALRRSAYKQAVAFTDKGLDLLQLVPADIDRDPLELSLQALRARALMIDKGYGEKTVEEAHTRTLELAKNLGNKKLQYQALWGLWGIHQSRAEYSKGYKKARLLLELAREAKSEDLILESHGPLGFSLIYRGQLKGGRCHLEKVCDRYDKDRHKEHMFQYAQDPKVMCQAQNTWPLWLMGFPDQALRSSNEAMAFAKELKHPASKALAGHYAALTYLLRQEPRDAQLQAEKNREFAEEKGFPLWLAFATLTMGAALVQQRDFNKGIMHLQQGLRTLESTGARLGNTYWHGFLAEAHVGKNDFNLARGELEKAFFIVNHQEERWWEAELYRLKGEFLLSDGELSPRPEQTTQSISQVREIQKEAELYFRQAIEVAEGRGAVSLQLRATRSLALLSIQQGKKAEAERMLTEMYRAFTEGFATKDLLEAKALLETLS